MVKRVLREAPTPMPGRSPFCALCMSTGAMHSDSEATDAVDVVLAHRQQAEYFSALSHELRTPLNGLLGYAKLLVEGHYGGLSSGQEKAVGEIQASAKHLLGIIESLLEFSKVSQGRQAPRPAAFRTDALVRRLTERLRPLAEAKKLELAREGDDLAVVSDEYMVEQILTNFLGNAIKFTPKVGRLRIVCRDLPHDDAFEIAVADSGPGIPPEARGRIFEPFVQLAPSNVRAHGGTGLGLSLCRWYASTLQGVVGVEGNQPQGAYVFALLPKRVVLAQDYVPYESFVARARQARAFARRVPDQFSVLEVINAPADLPAADLTRFARASDLAARTNGRHLLTLHGAEALTARMTGERIKNHFLYERRVSVNVKLLRLEELP